MQVYSTEKEREEILERLMNAPQTRDIKAAIKIVEEAEQFAELRKVLMQYMRIDGSNTVKQALSGYHHDTLKQREALMDELETIYKIAKAQKFKKLYGEDDDDGDDDMEVWKVI